MVLGKYHEVFGEDVAKSRLGSPKELPTCPGGHNRTSMYPSRAESMQGFSKQRSPCNFGGAL